MGIDPRQIGHTLDHARGVVAKTGFAVHQVLDRIVRGIADEWLGINGQPRLPLRAQNIPGVQVGGQEHITRRGLSELLHDAKALVDESLIGPEVSLGDSLLRPEVDHLRQGTKGAFCNYAWSGCPKPLENGGDDFILNQFRLRTQSRSRKAALKEHRPTIVVGGKQMDHGSAAPVTQALDFVLAFHVRHGKFQHGLRPVGTHHGRNPGGGTFMMERRIQTERPVHQ